MRNLKKVLSLALALVMLVGMMVVGAGATSFKDDDSIQNKEAVEVVSGIGVFEGDGTGNFNPKGTLTRAQAAVLIAKLDLGAAFGNLATTNASSFSDVPANHWGKAYIDYCAARGLIAGDGAGKFLPDQEVSGVGFALMVCRVLGYEDANEDVGGATWEVKAAALARKAGLTKDVTIGPDPMTRDEMAQVAFNALTADMVEYSSSAITIGDLHIPAGKAKPVESNNTVTYDSAADNKVQLCEEKFPELEKVTGDDDDFGRPADHKWTYNDDSIYNAPKSATITFTKSTSADDVLKAIKGYTFNGTKVVDKNTAVGSPATNIGDLSFTNAAEAIVTAVKEETANGTLVEIFATDKTVKDVVVVNYSVGDVTKVSTNKDGDVSYSITGAGTKKDFADPDKKDEIVIAGSIEEDDVVTYVTKNSVLYVYPTESFTGVQSAFNNAKKTITVDGETYTVKGGLTVDGTVGHFPNSSDEATFYLDQYGFVVKSDVAEVETSWAVLNEIAAVGGNGGLNSSKSAEAQLFFPDGTKANVEVTKIGNVAMKDATFKNDDAPAAVTYSGGKVAKLTINTSSDYNTALQGRIVKYSVSDEKYTLDYADVGSAGLIKAQSGTVVSSDGTAVAKVTTKGVPSFNVNGDESANTNATANNNTIYIIKKGSDDFEQYTGFKSVPDVTTKETSNGVKVSYALDNSKVAVVYIDVTAGTENTVSGSTSDIFYVTNKNYTTEGSGSNAVYVLTGILNGEAGEIRTKTESNFTELTEKTLVKLTLNGEGLVTATGTAGDYAAQDISAALTENGGLVAGKTYDDDTKVYVIEGSDVSVGDAKSVEAGDKVFIKVKGASGAAAETIDTMYVIKGGAAAAKNVLGTIDASSTAGGVSFSTAVVKTTGDAPATITQGNHSELAAGTYTVTITMAAGEAAGDTSSDKVTITLGGAGVIASSTNAALGGTPSWGSTAATPTVVTIDRGSVITTSHTITFTFSVAEAAVGTGTTTITPTITIATA